VGHLESADYRLDNLQRIDVPTVVLHGAEDPLVAVESAHEIAERVPDAALRVLPGLGHEVPAGVAEELVDAIVAAADRADSPSGPEGARAGSGTIPGDR
jgi:pimeloyl-ACP methyl ester carboxylesterase